jgi:hypothetical protein
MTTEALIRQLARQATPVTPTPHPLVRFRRFFLAAAICVALGVAQLGVRADLASRWRSPLFLVQAILLWGLAALSARAAFLLSVPDRRSRWLAGLPGAALVGWAAFLAGSALWGHPVEAGVGLKCVRNLLLLSAAPGLLLYVLLRSAAPLQTGATGLLAALSVAALADGGTLFLCRRDDVLHVLGWHFLPVLAVSGAGIWLGRLSFGYRTQR